MLRPLSSFLLLPLALASCLSAQDTRTVLEPFFPPFCGSVDARLQSVNGDIAPADVQKLDTARIQKAIDRCGKGRALMLRVDEEKNAFLSGPLVLRPDITLILGRGVTLYASSDPRLYDVKPGSCGVVDKMTEAPPGCKALINVDHASGDGIMGDGVIDGRGSATMLGSKLAWWDLTAQASKNGGTQQVPRLISVDNSDNFTLYRVTLRNSPKYSIEFQHGNGFTAWGVRVKAPVSAHNTDGFTIGNGVKNVTITQSYSDTGDDHLDILGGDTGASNFTLSHDHFYAGHGVSIGGPTNGGVSHIRMTDVSFDGPLNAIRIKTNGAHGGLTDDVLYEDICIRNSQNPITLDAVYGVTGNPIGNMPPTVKDFTLRNVRISGGGKITFNGYDHEHREAITLDGVQITDDAKYSYVLNHADITLGPAPTNLQLPAGNDSTVSGKPVEGTPASCADKFVPFPE